MDPNYSLFKDKTRFNKVEKFSLLGVIVLPSLFLLKNYFNGKKCQLKPDL